MYVFPPIESAIFVHNGQTETLDKDDPRLFRLLNALSYSYEMSYTYWLQGFVEEDEFLSFINSGCPMLDIRFCLEDAPPYKTEFADTPRAIISANCYLLLVDTTKSSWMPDGSIYANQHFPFGELLINYYRDSFPEVEREAVGDLGWGDSKWIDLLAYAGFQ